MKKILISICAIATLSSCGNTDARHELNANTEKTTTSTTNYTPTITDMEDTSDVLREGQDATVTEKCIWASSEETFKTMTKLCNRRDEEGLELMELRGEVGILEAGEQGVVTEVDYGKVRIRLSGGQEVWVASEFLR